MDMAKLTAAFRHLYERETQIPQFPPVRDMEYSHTHTSKMLTFFNLFIPAVLTVNILKVWGSHKTQL